MSRRRLQHCLKLGWTPARLIKPASQPATNRSSKQPLLLTAAGLAAPQHLQAGAACAPRRPAAPAAPGCSAQQAQRQGTDMIAGMTGGA